MGLNKYKRWIRNNGLLLTLTALFVFSFAGQLASGFISHNEDLIHHLRPALKLSQYLVSGHFIEATFENWESEFLQMGIYVVLTAILYQRGSAESNPLPEDQASQKLFPRRYFKCHPVLRKFYENSLSLALFVLFFISFGLHAYGGWKEENLKRSMSSLAQAPQTLVDFATSADFWFQSFQNWQSEFLSVGAIVYLSIYLRQAGSSQSKEVDAPHMETGD